MKENVIYKTGLGNRYIKKNGLIFCNGFKMGSWLTEKTLNDWIEQKQLKEIITKKKKYVHGM